MYICSPGLFFLKKTGPLVWRLKVKNHYYTQSLLLSLRPVPLLQRRAESVVAIYCLNKAGKQRALLREPATHLHPHNKFAAPWFLLD